MELGPEDVSLLERCPHFRGCYVQDLKMCPYPHFRGSILGFISGSSGAWSPGNKVHLIDFDSRQCLLFRESLKLV